MRGLIIAAVVLVLFYPVFIIGPAVSAFFFVFSRKKWKEPGELSQRDGSIWTYANAICDGAEFIESLPKKRVEITAFDGKTLVGYIYGRKSSRLAICFHGYHSSPLTNFGVMGRDLLEEGYDLLLVHQRAHGESGGERCTVGLLESRDVLSWVDFADKQDDIDEIILCGVSMGSACIAYASDCIDSGKVRGMILDSCFDRVYDQMLSDCRKWHLPGLLIVPIMRLCAKKIIGIELRTRATINLSMTDVPALFIHGTGDSVVPVEVGRRCYDACASSKCMTQIEGADHGVAYAAGGDKAKSDLSDFLKLSADK